MRSPCGLLHLRSQQRRPSTQRPEQPGPGLGIGGPDVVAGEADVLPAQRGDVAHQVGRHRGTPGGERIEGGKAEWPSLREAVLDGGFVAERCRDWSNGHGMRHRVVERDPRQKGFVVLERRWVVERSFGWLAHWGGLLRDRAGRLDVSAARIAFVAILSSVEALLNPMPIHAAAS